MIIRPPKSHGTSRLAVANAGTMSTTVRAHIAHGLVLDLDKYLAAMVQAWCISRNRPGEAENIEAKRRHLLRRAADLTLPINRGDLMYSESEPTGKGIPNDSLHT